MNRLANCHNRFQGSYKKVLCICSAGLLRSPTVALVLSQEPFNFNTRAAGITEEYALIPVDPVLLEWADEFVVMESWMVHLLEEKLIQSNLQNKNIYCLNIPDNYEYRHPDLMKFIADKYRETHREILLD